MLTTSSGKGVQSVERAFLLLTTISGARGEVGSGDLSLATNLPLTVIRRLLQTLEKLGYVRRLDSGGYVLELRLIRLGDAAKRQFGVLARPYLKKLVDQLGESANMAVLDSDMVVYIAHVPSFHPMRSFTEVGSRAHLQTTGVGKAILAELPAGRVREIVSRMRRASVAQRGISSLNNLLTEISEIRRRGYSADDGQQEVGVRGYAMAIPGAPAPTAISISGPAVRIGEDFRERAIPLLRAAAASISSELQLF
ncbi:MAG: IclR family transcriptional regulator [Lacisediminihabitans sp.]